MWHSVLAEASFYELLLRIDGELAEEVRRGGCRACGGRLHSARYPRKPRGALVGLGPDYERRASYCCDVGGCRRRATPPSVLYLGRRVYIGAVVVVATVLRHGVTPMRLARLRELFGVDRRTLMRWRRWWCESFVRTPVWKSLRGRLDRPVGERLLPGCLLERLIGNPDDKLIALLRLLTPLGVGD